MKNKFLAIFISIFFFHPLLANNLNIQSSQISIDKESRSTILKGEVIATDYKNNIFKTDYAEYKKDLKFLKSTGKTTVLTSEGYFLNGENIIFDNKNGLIKSDYETTLKDLENNNIYLENFEYSIENNFFKSTGKIKVIDSNDNKYNFSQIYVDEKKREIIGTDIKAFLNQEDFKVNKDNKPRVFANTVKIENQNSEFTKSIFTLCNYRKEDKCPPWSLQASKMAHDKKKKTIYYDNAVIKIYDFPIFYLPKLSHPDPSVDRRSGFLPPSFSDSKNLGASFEVPYFWDLGRDKDITFSTKLFTSEHPLFLGEHRQAFKKSNLISNFGYTEGYKNTSGTKLEGSKYHFFSQFVKKFKNDKGADNELKVSIQKTSNKKYLKLYKINNDLVNYENDILENSLSFSHENEDLFIGLKASAYEDLTETSKNDEYEYILPDIILDKNLFSSTKYGYADLQSNLIFHNFETNKLTKFLINDIDWKYKENKYSSGLKGRLLGKLKNVNYETKNTEIYKSDTTNELFGAVGYLAQIDLFKKMRDNTSHILTPKLLFRYAPGHMRKETEKSRLNHSNIFTLDRLNTNKNFENGLSSTLGFDYEFETSDKKLDFSIAQIINEKENQNMPSSSSLNQRFSDVIGSSELEINDNIKFNYNFALDQNYQDLNYNELGASFNLNPIKFDFNYLEEKEHIGDQEYFKGKVDLTQNKYGLFSAETKRNLITDSAEYYNLSYEYTNDCLRAGLVYRREFYNDSELEPEDSLMFKITLTPFGNINSPSFN
ncbi:MAG: hypothetical protein CBD26_04090 [Candidatus Pelagibacter sp. TMED166]|nr:MAG: hypothetical protein CBD26_04090 [Candidatus Pelagibacter sp. TMED166]|tara:strand:+ start:1511 stop:3823 length:2313 start_codon:yes stop_codon:yes gene_type:complete